MKRREVLVAALLWAPAANGFKIKTAMTADMKSVK